MRKTELIREISKKTGTEKAVVETTIEAFMASVKEHVSNKEPVTLRGFGAFGVKKRAAKIGRNITQNTSMKLPAHFIPSFKPSKKFKERVKKSIKQV